MEVIVLYDGNYESAKSVDLLEMLTNLKINVKIADTGEYN